MKITTFLLLISILSVSAAGYAQKITLHERGASLEQLLDQVRQQSGYNIIYSDELLGQGKTQTVNLSNASLEETLKAILADQSLTYEIDNKTIVIKAKEPGLIEKAKALFAQVTVTGKVTDELGNPMTGVTVKQKDNPRNVTATDAKGSFSLTVPDGNTIVTFSYVGYDPREIAAKDLPKGVVITLKPNETNLHEVTIFKGYYSEKQALSTGDVAVVNAKTIEDQPVTDPILALEGRVPGLLISQTSGLPGAYSTVRLRGQNSIAQGNDPLYVVDGLPFSSVSLTNQKIGGGPVGQPGGSLNYSTGTGLSPFNMLNPEDIENIEVLKDADATAIYGSRGANGVILITTKKGRAGTVKVDFSISQGAGKLTRTMDLMNTQQYLQMMHQAYGNSGLPFPSITATPTNSNYSVNGVWDTTRNTNWQKELASNTAHYTNAQLSLSGGSANTQFYFGTAFSRQNTVYPGTTADAKGSANFSLSHNSTDQRFELRLSLGYTYDDNTLPNADPNITALNLAPDAPALYNPDGSLNWQLYNGTATFTNPLKYIFQKDEAVTNTLNSNLAVSYKLFPGLKLQSSFGFSDGRQSQNNITPSTAVAPPNNLITTNRTDWFGNSEISNWIIEPQISYEKAIGHGNLNVLVGGTLEQSVTNEIGFIGMGYNSDALLNNPVNAATLLFRGTTNTLYRYQAIYARIGYTWKDKYLLNLTANRDGSSRFGPSNKWGNFGAIGAGWVFSKEKFVENALPWLSFGKLRGSYGITGNDQIIDYGYLNAYSTDAIAYQGSTGLNPTIAPNPYYGWEVDKKLEGGIELGFLKDRINLSFSYYQNRTANQLVPYPLSFITGFSSVFENLPAVVQNTGAEFSLHTVNIKTADFRWSSDFNLTIPANKLVSYPGLASSSYKNTYVVGQSLFIRKEFIGTKVNPADGQYEWLAANGSYTENPNNPADLQTSPPITPQYFGALGNSFSYKGFQLDIFFEFRKQLGLNYWSQTHGYRAGTEGSNQPALLAGATWTGANQNAAYGKYTTNNAADPHFDTFQSDFVVSDASFIRLKNVAFSWTLPKSWQEKVHMNNTRVFLNAQNLLTITNYFGLDPETGSSNLPPLRMITMGVRSSF